MTDQTFTPPAPSLQQQTQRAWAIGRLHRAGAVDRLAAVQSLDAIYTNTTNRALRRLCETVAFQMFPEAAKPQPDVGPGIEVYAR